MRPRRYLIFSLSTLFVFMTALAVWLGVMVNRAREQREAVEAIEALGGAALYDWMLVDDSQEIKFRPVDEQRPRGPDQLRSLLGNDFFQHVEAGQFPWADSEALKSIPAFQRLRGLKTVIVPPTISANALGKIKIAFPHCKILTPPQ